MPPGSGRDTDDVAGMDSDAESDYSTPSLPPFSVSDGSSHTSVNASMRSASPVPSVWSLTSSLRQQVFRNEYGRGLNNYSEVYRLPADDEELERLDKQHEMFKCAMGKYPSVLAQVMADDIPGETKAVLDLGCGSGSWILEVARDFPHCSAVAVDLVPMQITEMPPNLRSEVDDINLGLEHFYGDFNVVHSRLISAGIIDYPGLIDHVSRVLRPGGLIDFSEFAFNCYDENKQPVLVETTCLGAPWLARWLAFSNMAVRQRGGSPDAATELYTWISQHGAFEEVVHKSSWIAASPWIRGDDPQSVWERGLGEAMRDDILAFLKSARPLLLGSGLAEGVVDELEEGARTELMEAKIPYWICVEQTYARKRVT